MVAPATAHWLGAMAGGLAGDVVTATCLAIGAPVVVAPAMDGDMWTPSRRRVANVARLRDDSATPSSSRRPGPLASGQSGVGRLAELPAIVDAVVAAVADRPVRAAGSGRPPARSSRRPRDADLAGRHVVVSAGGTREPIDPVRFIGNRSTGRMGVAVAAAALDRGARVTVIAANIEVPMPPEARRSSGSSRPPTSRRRWRTRAMAATADAGFDALVMAAAVADFRPATPVRPQARRAATG